MSTRARASFRAVPAVPTLILAGLLAAPHLLAAQEPAGVRLGILYQAEYQPGLVVLPVASEVRLRGEAADVREIVERDLDYSDRFRMLDPGRMQPGDEVNPELWRERGADWLVESVLVRDGDRNVVEVSLHDLAYGEVREREAFRIPRTGASGFRMAVHEISDQIVRWATGTPGMAASRIAFVREGREGAKEIFLVDSDGENVERVTDDGSLALSPAWAPDGRRIVYTSFRTGGSGIYERDLATGRVRTIAERDGTNITPAYAPDGRTVAFATSLDGNTEIVTARLAGSVTCCERKTRGRRFDSLSPTYSPDGRQIAFVSDRLGAPHLYVMSANGGDAVALTEYVHGRTTYHVAPEWSSRGPYVAFETRVGGVPQIAVIHTEQRRVQILTSEGRNEDPSWAPDGRHLVFSSDRDGGGLYVVDTVSGRIRPLVRGRGLGLPAWSPSFSLRGR